MFGATALVILALPSTARAQTCETGTPHPAGMVDQGLYNSQATLAGFYFLDDTQGSREGGTNSDGYVDWMVVRGEDGSLRGSAPVDHNGAFLITVFGNASESGAPLFFQLCDYQRDVTQIAVLRVQADQQGYDGFDPAIVPNPGTPLVLEGTALPHSLDSWSDYQLSPDVMSGLRTMTFTAYVTVHGVESEDPTGVLGAFWSGIGEPSGYGTWLMGQASPVPDAQGRVLYTIQVSGFEFGDQITFVHVGLDPRSGEPSHVGIGRDAFNFIPGSSLGTRQYPLDIVVLHPPLLTASIPGQVIDSGEQFESIDLNDFVIDPTGQQIDFRIAESEHLFAGIDSTNVLRITYPTGWTGVDHVRIEARHSTAEITIREASFVVVDPASRFPFWTTPIPGAFRHTMTVIAAFDPESGITKDHYPLVGAFEGNVLRGSSTAITVGDEVIFIIPVHSDNPGAEIGFDAYIMVEDQYFSVPGSVAFVPNTQVGSVLEPFRLGLIVTDTQDDEVLSSPALSLDSIYPNPATRGITLRYSIPTESPAKIWVADILGRQRSLRMVPGGGQANGEVSLDLPHLSPGFYLVVLETNSGRVSKPLVVLRE
jgi:Secretion system C-terminal sorting domain